eukprot:1241584-Rhodomonas_salina.2
MGNNNFVVLMCTLQVVLMQHNYAFSASVLSPEPKTQHKSLSRADVQDWIDTEFIKMDTIY